MLRIPNPGSDITTFASVFRELFSALKDFKSFDLDDMSRVLVTRNLMTSSGFMGEQALEHGFRTDRSLDGPFNQSKMYSELLRVLGWIHPAASRADFKFTLLGEYIASARLDRVSLLDECLLGIVYPNPFVSAKGTTNLRPFAAVLRSLGDLDGLLTRDEMIIGPLSLTDDRDPTEWATMVTTIKNMRGSKARLTATMDALQKTLRISKVTMGNYTRFPIGALQKIDWMDRATNGGPYGKGTFFRLTDHGSFVYSQLQSLRDVRRLEVLRLEDDVRHAIIRTGFYQILERAGYDSAPVARELAADAAVLALAGFSSGLLFSPFQQLTLDEIAPVFGDISGIFEADAGDTSKEERVREVVITLVPMLAGEVEDDTGEPEALLITALAVQGNSPDQIVDSLFVKYADANKDVFYPLIGSLFRIIGFDCQPSRVGVNYQRYDAILEDPTASIPVEIKSPGEEPFLSVKAVRQALENKIILLSRKGFETKKEVTSLVVCYNLPNDRAEVSGLARDFLNVYGIRVGICDMRSLLRLAVAKVLSGRQVDRSAFERLIGILDIADAS